MISERPLMNLEDALGKLCGAIMREMATCPFDTERRFAANYLAVFASGPSSRLAGRIGTRFLNSLNDILGKRSEGELSVLRYERGQDGVRNFVVIRRNKP
jgi:hypothetical protein